ncbi:hypothetical protein Q3G72_011695 [Acer saccharum]|nr:hypothetical protein Q3G72_011695 [Acer saccharum]
MSSQYAATKSTSTGVHKKEVVHEQRNKSQALSILSCQAQLLKSYSHVHKHALDSLVDKLQRDIKCGQGYTHLGRTRFSQKASIGWRPQWLKFANPKRKAGIFGCKKQQLT